MSIKLITVNVIYVCFYEFLVRHPNLSTVIALLIHVIKVSQIRNERVGLLMR